MSASRVWDSSHGWVCTWAHAAVPCCLWAGKPLSFVHPLTMVPCLFDGPRLLFWTPQAVFTQPTPPSLESWPPKLKLQHSVPTCPGGQANKYLRLESANRHWLSLCRLSILPPEHCTLFWSPKAPCLLSLPVRGLHSIRNSFTAPPRGSSSFVYIFFSFSLPYSLRWCILAFWKSEVFSASIQ